MICVSGMIGLWWLVDYVSIYTNLSEHLLLGFTSRFYENIPLRTAFCVVHYPPGDFCRCCLHVMSCTWCMPVLGVWIHQWDKYYMYLYMFFYLIVFTPMNFIVHTRYSELLSYKPRANNCINPSVTLFLAKIYRNDPSGNRLMLNEIPFGVVPCIWAIRIPLLVWTNRCAH